MKTDKRFWVNVAAGTVAVVAIVFGAKQCSDKNTAVRDAEAARNSVLVDVRNGVDSLRQDARDIKDLVEQHDEDIKGAIKEHDGRVNEKLDTLAAHCDSLRNSMAKPCKPAPVKKPAAKKPVQAQPAKPAPVVDQTPVIFVATDKDTVSIRGNVETPTQTVVITGDNNGVVVVNGNGIVRVNNNAKDKVEEARQAYNDACQTGCTVVLKQRVKCR